MKIYSFLLFVIVTTIGLKASTGNLVIQNNKEGTHLIAVMSGLPLGEQCHVIEPFGQPLTISSQYQNPTGCLYFFTSDQFNKNESQALKDCPNAWQNTTPIYQQHIDINPSSPTITLTYPDFMKNAPGNCASNTLAN